MSDHKPYGVLLTDPAESAGWYVVQYDTLEEAQARAEAEQQHQGPTAWPGVEIAFPDAAPRIEGACQCRRYRRRGDLWWECDPATGVAFGDGNHLCEGFCHNCGAWCDADGWGTPSPLYRPKGEEAKAPESVPFILTRRKLPANLRGTCADFGLDAERKEATQDAEH